MFDILPRELQSVAVRARVRYAPHPYVWMASAGAHNTGLVIESENKEPPFHFAIELQRGWIDETNLA